MSPPPPPAPSRFFGPARHSALSVVVGDRLLVVAALAVARAFLRGPLLRHLLLGGSARLETDRPDQWFLHPRLEVVPGSAGRGDRLQVLDATSGRELTIETDAGDRSALGARDPGSTVIRLRAPPLATVHVRGSADLTVECAFVSAPASRARLARPR